ncbi:site-specific integrase [Paenibacillus larvae]|uniref:site-specific integrase n=1 Tax=Paenibacillus larvae TaxID=1464 RepID=UPI0022822127|nr:site-specific integrase [Paenibacillus larvae]MCY9500040.1 site-specific integrase [Paenibacillus larvae]
MASFQKYSTKDGVRWMYKYYSSIDPNTGKKRQSTKRGFKTKKEAQLDAARLEQEIVNGTCIIENKNITFEEIYQDWFKKKSRSYKPSTKRAVQIKFRKRILPYFGKLRIKDITESYCQEFINKLSKEIKSVGDFKMYANQVFEYAIKQKSITSNPLKDVSIPKKESEFIAEKMPEVRNFWEKSEIISFLQIVKQECSFRDYLLFHLLIYTGARKGEVLALRWSDIDFANKIIKFTKTLYHEDKEFLSLTSKTASSRRSISIDDTTLGFIKKYYTSNSSAQNQHVDSKDNHLIFTREDGTPLRLAYANDKLDQLIKSHNIHPITIHGLRHTHASLLFESGASIKEVQERLGHSDIKMTMNIYTHVTNVVKEKTATRFEKFLQL